MMMQNEPENVDLKNWRSHEIDELRKRELEMIIENEPMKVTPKSFVNTDKFKLYSKAPF
jgi:hypothetical protein